MLSSRWCLSEGVRDHTSVRRVAVCRVVYQHLGVPGVDCQTVLCAASMLETCADPLYMCIDAGAVSFPQDEVRRAEALRREAERARDRDEREKEKELELIRKQYLVGTHRLLGETSHPYITHTALSLLLLVAMGAENLCRGMSSGFSGCVCSWAFCVWSDAFCIIHAKSACQRAQ